MNNSIEPYNKCYYINLDRAVERKKYMERTLFEQKITAERFPAVDGNTIHEEIPNPYNFPSIYWNKYALGLVRTCRNIIIDASNNDYETIMILEDDIVFQKDFSERLKKYCSQLPDDWGVVQLSVGSFKRDHTVNYINNNVVQIEGTCGTFGMLINKRFYNIISNIIENAYLPLDDMFIYIQREFKKSYAFYPGLLKPQDGIESSITGQECNYSKIFDYIHPIQVKTVIDNAKKEQKYDSSGNIIMNMRRHMNKKKNKKKK